MNTLQILNALRPKMAFSDTPNPFSLETLAKTYIGKDLPTQAEMDAKRLELENQEPIKRANDSIDLELNEIDLQSIRSLREYVAAQADAPQSVKDKEAAAVKARSRKK